MAKQIKSSKPAMVKPMKEPKQRGSAKEEEEEVYEVEAILSHRKVSISGHSKVITDRYCSFLWFIHIVSMCDYIPRLRDTCCRDWGWGGGYGPYRHMQCARSITCIVLFVYDMTSWCLQCQDSGAHNQRIKGVGGAHMPTHFITKKHRKYSKVCSQKLLWVQWSPSNLDTLGT